jgi:hypothetical protein
VEAPGVELWRDIKQDEPLQRSPQLPSRQSPRRPSVSRTAWQRRGSNPRRPRQLVIKVGAPSWWSTRPEAKRLAGLHTGPVLRSRLTWF